MKTTGLTIQEAIQSGFPYKREAWANYCQRGVDISSFSITNLDILATDWQIKLPEVTITREKLAEAWDKVIFPKFGVATAEHSTSFEDFYKEMGL